ncbi:hypothetical protein DENSPDRAFT_622907 [Dentipellis sp. KUC8613]|nr:hypothetical protein DENSPDRAFT_622907 [Dentipellis sp. KUC8613]
MRDSHICPCIHICLLPSLRAIQAHSASPNRVHVADARAVFKFTAIHLQKNGKSNAPDVDALMTSLSSTFTLSSIAFVLPTRSIFRPPPQSIATRTWRLELDRLIFGWPEIT